MFLPNEKFYLHVYLYKFNQRKDEQYLRVFSRSTTILMENNMHIYVPKRFMLSRAVQTTTKIGAEVVTPALTTEGPWLYSIFIVNDLGSVQDTNRCGHKTLSKVECETLYCDSHNCDPCTQTVAFVGHLTQSTKGLEEARTTVELKDTVGPRGVPSQAVIYNEKESIPKEKLYEGYHYAETMSVQKEENTSTLNKLTKNMSDLKSNDEQE